ncbi:MAG: LysM peptidoglycan-binding domain-containing protein [Alcaligenaceae bacterium]|nr:LysM peptidoglycan-binding domain-containing protein [Alcaligenaceae bacterium]
MKIQHFFCCLFASLLTLITQNAIAQPAGAQGEYFLYHIKQGETLSSLSETFTSRQSNWQQIKKINNITNTRKIPVGTVLQIPFQLIDETPDQAKIIYLTGEVQINKQPGRKQQLINEADTITTGAQSNITFELSDESKVQIPPDSTVVIQRLRKFQGTGLIDSVFNIQTGNLAAHASPKETGVGRFEIRTPVSITGVRGTVLRTGTSNHTGANSELLQGQAAFIAWANRHQAINIESNQGITANTSGTAGDIIDLLPPPEINLNQTSPFEFSLNIAPVPEASTYLVRVSNDIAGYDVISSHITTKTLTSVTGPGKGTYYVSVRSIDGNKLAGADAILPFTITATGITTESGVSIGTSAGALLQMQY